MSLSPTLVCTWLAVLAYVGAALPVAEGTWRSRACSYLLILGWALHGTGLLLEISGFTVWGAGSPGPRLGFAPVLSASVWLVIAVHEVESHLLPVPVVRMGLALAGAMVAALTALYPGEVRPFTTALGPWHFVLGVAAYALIAAAVLHGLWLGAAETRMRKNLGQPAHKHASEGGLGAVKALGMPLLQLERLTYRFVQVGFGVLSLTLLLGALAPHGFKLEHKTLFSLLAWLCFAVLLWGRATRGWRGRVALRWLYVGAALLLMAYAGSRFVYEVVLGRPWQ
jgi:ABC-type uncharacterized transport system permease subunit